MPASGRLLPLEESAGALEEDADALESRGCSVYAAEIAAEIASPI